MKPSSQPGRTSRKQAGPSRARAAHHPVAGEHSALPASQASLGTRFPTLVAALGQVIDGDLPADAALHRFFREYRRCGVQDRAFVAEGVYGTLRRWHWLKQVVTSVPGGLAETSGIEATTDEASGMSPCLTQPAAGSVSPHRLALAFLALVQGRSRRELEPLCRGNDIQWLDGIRASSPPVGMVERADLPGWVIERLQPEFSPDQILALGRALQLPAPLDLRINPWLSDRSTVMSELSQAGLVVEPTPWSPLGIRVQGHPALAALPAFASGRVEVQDEGSQLLCLLVAPQRREMVVDFCAGAGGKTLLLGALMANQGRVYAFDIARARLDRLRPRLKRSGLSNVTPVLIAHEREDRVRRLEGKIDRVLVDAPCSGLGTLRRNPDLKWRQNQAGLELLCQKQQAILNAAARLVKPGGELVYATCSLLPEENELQVQCFEQAHPDFEALSCGARLAEQQVQGISGLRLRLQPDLHYTDGFFAALWRRRPARVVNDPLISAGDGSASGQPMIQEQDLLP